MEVDRRCFVVGADVGRPGARSRLHPDQRRDDGSTYGGFRPGDNLFSTSVIALDVKTGKRVWHHQQVKHDIWNYDTPNAPVLLDVNVNGRRIPGVFRSPSSRGSTPTTARRESRSGRSSNGPRRSQRCRARSCRRRSRTSPSPRRSISRVGAEEHLIDFTPEIRKLALQRAQERDLLAPLFVAAAPSRQRRGQGPGNTCPGGNGGANITGPPAADPTTGVIFITSISGCSPTLLAPAIERDNDKMTGKTVAQWATARGSSAAARRSRCRTIRWRAFPDLFKGPVGRITAIDLNTGEHLWMIPHGDMDDEAAGGVPQQPAAEGHERRHQLGPPQSCGDGRDVDAAAGDGQTADDKPQLFAIDKKTGKRVGQVPHRRLGRYGLMTYLHQGKQYIVLPRNGGYTAVALP